MSNLAMESQSDQNPNLNSQHDNHESVQPSFDEVVELISTGRADQIPGIKEIPLKINEAMPSAPTMSRPAKPWERAAAQQDDSDDVVSTSQKNDNTKAENTNLSKE